jgi:hypothetical protein
MLRKQAEADRLRDRISSLEDAIEAMSHEFIEFGDRVANFSQTKGKVQILEDLKQTTRRFLEFARAAEMAASGEEGTTSSPAGSQGRVVSEASQSLAEVHHQVRPTPPTAPSFPNPQTCLPSDLGFTMPFELSSLFSATTLNPTYSKIGQFSPRLTYGILTNYFPSHLWSHYQISGPNSFATRIYMETPMMIILALQGQMDLPGFIPSIFRYRFRHDNPSDFISLANNQLASMSISPHDNNSPEEKLVIFGPEDPVMTDPTRGKIYEEIEEREGNLKEWLDPWDTQEHLSRKWGLQLTYSDVRVSSQTLGHLPPSWDLPLDDIFLAATSDPNMLGLWDKRANFAADDYEVPKTSDLVFNAKPLAMKLIQESVCFGEGPRFFKRNIDVAASSFLGNVIIDSSLALPIPIV